MAQLETAAGDAVNDSTSANPEDLLVDEIENMLGEEEEEEQPDAEEGDEGDESEPDGEGEEGDDEGGEEDAPPAVEAPVSWSKEDKELFASLPPEAQAVVARREAERDRFVNQKAQEAASTRTQVEQEARQFVSQLHNEHAERLQTYAAMLSPQEPDQRLLYTGNPDDVLIYHRQEAAFRSASAQQHQLQQQIEQSRVASQRMEEEALNAEAKADAQHLYQQFPEWFDPSESPKLRQSLQSIGAELGYSPEHMAQARAVDVLGLRKAADWKAKADKYDALNRSKMEAVRAAKGLPKVAKPGAKPSKAQVNAGARDAAWQRVKTTKSGDAMADWLDKSGSW